MSKFGKAKILLTSVKYILVKDQFKVIQIAVVNTKHVALIYIYGTVYWSLCVYLSECVISN